MNRNIAGWVTHHWAKWVILVLSLGLIMVMGSLGAKLTSVQENDISSWLPGDAESTKVINKSSEFSDPDAIPAVVLYVRDSGITPLDMAKATADSLAFKQVDTVNGNVVGPIPSEDGKALQVIPTLNMGDDGWERLPDLMADLKAIANDDAGDLEVALAGPAALGADQAEAFSGIDGILLLSAVLIVFVILLITYRSLQLAILFLLCGVAAVGVAQGFVYLLAKYADLTVNGQSAGILSVLVLGAGVDYALLLVARYREELHNYEDRHEAMAHALHRAAPAVLASGATVIIGLLCLVFAQMNSTRGLGPVGAAGIACALLVMMILLPALLVIVGRWIFWPFVPHFGDPIKSEKGFWSKIGQRISKAPRAVWVTTTLVLIGLGFGITQLDANGLSNEESFTKEQPSVVAEAEARRTLPRRRRKPRRGCHQHRSIRRSQAGTPGCRRARPGVSCREGRCKRDHLLRSDAHLGPRLHRGIRHDRPRSNCGSRRRRIRCARRRLHSGQQGRPGGIGGGQLADHPDHPGCGPSGARRAPALDRRSGDPAADCRRVLRRSARHQWSGVQVHLRI